MRKLRSMVLLLLAAALMCFTLAGCGQTSSQIESEAKEQIEAQDLEDIANFTQQYFADTMVAASYEQFQAYVDSGTTWVSVTFDNDFGVRWKEFRDAHGEVTDAAVDLTQKDGTDYTSRIILTGEDGQQMALTVTYNEAMQPVKTAIADYSDDSKQSLGSKMATAGANTITGLLVVFVILIGLSLIISCFKFIGRAEKKPENKDNTANAVPVAASRAPAQTAPSAEEIDLAKNQELVAVIAAAIAAYEDKPVEGYTVRSIRRLKSNKWR